MLEEKFFDSVGDRALFFQSVYNAMQIKNYTSPNKSNCIYSVPVQSCLLGCTAM
jgi:hypothetical protein